jgi:hypothetical protein
MGDSSHCEYQLKKGKGRKCYLKNKKALISQGFLHSAINRVIWRPQGDSNPCTHRERVMS